MQALGGEDVGFDQPVERHQREGGRADLIGQGRKAQRHAFASEALGLAVQGLVLPVLGKRLLRRPLARKRSDAGRLRCGALGGEFVLAGAGMSWASALVRSLVSEW
jgi:hypothetical protein